ncbi:hypothetical protein D3H65_09440 [Paraflavitalea soli]|uniref:Uncharacterized protein n=1 Tax=Paraflavitalea soli TaxID=2315862 RepID=A0A3B7MIC5_9BACT|nr:hypothetical protein [Paraflavitalea soli]AXY74184.1 hypothetical protein D3H65_09440 [Paraflavitalea soli]
MKQSTVGCPLIWATFVFITATAGCREKKQTNEQHPVDSTQSTTPVMESTIVTTPANMVVFVHKVGNYNKWKIAYDAHDSFRLAHGLHNYVIGRSLFDSNTVMVALKADDMAKAKAFAASADLKNVMHRAGVTGTPETYFVLATWQDTSEVGRLPRSMTTLKVKDWNSWLKNFQEGAQERIENGIKARLVGHDPDDLTKVSIVSAIEDTSKAFAYFRSEVLKKRMESAGVVGNPNRRLFQFVQRY